MRERHVVPCRVRGEAAGRTGYLRAGSGPVLILVHGVGMNAEVWTPQLEALCARFDVIAYDMLGHGASSLPPADARLGDYSDQLDQLRRALAIERAHLVGHSMGALVSLDHALAHPGRVRSVVALNAVYDRSPEARAAVERRAFALDGGAHDGASHEAAIGRWFGDPVPAQHAGAASLVRDLLHACDPCGYARSYRVFATSDDAHLGRLSRLDVPAFFLTGELDPNSTPAMSHAMAKAAPRGHAETVRQERHMMPLTVAAAVTERIGRFIEADAPVLERASLGIAS